MSAVEAPAGTLKARRGRRIFWPVLGVAGVGALALALLVGRCGSAAEVREVEQLTADARTFVELVRGGLPATWSIEKVLEFPTLRPGSQAMLELQHRRGQARVNLENKVDALVPAGERPDLSGMTEWIATPSWMTRARVAELAGQLHALDQALARLRRKHGLEPAPLALDGELLAPLPTRVPLPTLPDGVESAGVELWPLPLAVVALQWGHSEAACRAGSPACRYRQVTWLSWQGELIATTTIEAPLSDETPFMYGVGGDAAFHTLEVATKGPSRLASYAPGEAPSVGELALPPGRIDVGSTSHGFVIAVEPALYGPAAQYLALRPGGAIEPVEDAGVRVALGIAALDRREGGSVWTGGGTLAIERREAVVYSTVTPDGAKVPEAVCRIADFVGQDEELMRALVFGEAGAVLAFEGSKSRYSVVLSRDGGRSWTGAAPP